MNFFLTGFGLEYYVLSAVSLIIIFSYLFDTFARHTKFPSVILLILLGIGLRYMADYYTFTLPYLNQIIPVLGKVGLILIVLEGALELELNRDKLPVILKSLAAAFFIMGLCAGCITLIFHFMHQMPWNESLMDAIPLSIISSAVAIPSAAGLMKLDKEFVVYESTFSDIIGIILFTYVSSQLDARYPFSPASFLGLGLELILVVLFAIAITYVLIQLIERISHKVKFFLILAILILSYVMATAINLSALIIIFFFGLFLSNPRVFIPKILQRFITLKNTEDHLHEFHILTAESTFFIRSFFFLFFGYSITVGMFFNPYNYLYGLIILAVIFGSRFLYFALFKRQSIGNLAYIAPRGLITILLFLQIPDSFKNEYINEKVLLIVILGSMLIMLIGTLQQKRKKGNGHKTFADAWDNRHSVLDEPDNYFDNKVEDYSPTNTEE